MAFAGWVFCFVTVALSIIQTQAGVRDWYYRCCTKGDAKAKAYRGDFAVCEKDDLDRRRFGNLFDRMVCRIAERTCCMKRLQSISCDKGRYDAMQDKTCARSHGYSGSDRYLRCCDCCTLGIKAKREKNLACDQVTMKEDPLCSTVFRLCCNGQNFTVQPGVHYTYAPHPARTTATTTKLPQTTTAKLSGCATAQCEHICREDFRKIPVCFCKSSSYFIGDDGKSCLDVDECARYPKLCPSDQTCVNTKGSYRCVKKRQCSSGFALSQGRCKDIDECARNRLICGGARRCINAIGSYRCEDCSSGYRLQNNQCIDINECGLGNDCSIYAVCINTPGSYVCKCRDGYQGDGKLCAPITTPKDCKRGFRRIRGRCADIDECAEGSHGCVSGKTCKNTRGSYTCISPVACSRGYTKDSNGKCTDIDECTLSVCRQDQTCRNLPGTYECIDGATPNPCSRRRCPDGYQCKVFGERGYRCEDIDECLKNPCDAVATCQNFPGNYRCRCPNGYRQNPYIKGRCQDINECRYHVCEQDCKNTRGSYKCSCRDGFKLDSNKYCLNIDECATQNPCQGNCRDTRGSFTCSCDPGYRLNRDQRTCSDIDECREGVGRRCAHTCKNTPGSFKCTCRRGWKLAVNRFQCIDDNECEKNPKICGSLVCLNMWGSHQCVDFNCPPRSVVPSSQYNYYKWETPNRKCVKRDCSDGDKACFDLKNKAFNLWIFNVAVGTKPIDLFTYRIILQGYKDDTKPILKYSFQSGNEEGLFEIDVPASIYGKVFVRNKDILTRAGFYRLVFVGELFWSNDNKLVSRYMHYLYVNVYRP